MALTRRTILKAVAITAVVGLAIAAVLWLRCGLRGCPDVDLLAGYVPEEASVVLDRDGEELSKLYLVQRIVVPLDSLPEYVPAAFIAIEDQRFWDHGGVDWRRVPGALFANLRAGGVEQGFSTITMQLARNLFPEKLPASERTLWRKLGEMRVAREIEGRYEKEEILQMYLNQIYFGSGAWGIEAAAQEYFGKSAKELELSEAALLAGLPVAPSRNNPRANRDIALERRSLVLRKMVEEGAITEAEAEAARNAELELARTREQGSDVAPYFVELVRRQLEEQLGDMIYTEGLRIHTTLDKDIQSTAEEELRQQLDAIEAGRYGVYRHARYDPDASQAAEGGQTPYVQGALVFMETESGNVLALVGGRDFDDSKYDRAVQAKRQPGSAFKPFVYAAAIARGYPPTYPLDDTPLSMEIDGRVWRPQNYGGSYAGRIPLRDALVHSKNVATVRLAERIGLGNVIETAHAMGIEEDIPQYPSVVLGAAEVPLLEMVAAYAAFATLGERPRPRFVTRVEDRDGNVVWQSPIETRRVVDPAVAFIVTDMLQDVVDRGTATAVRAVGVRGPVAGKTGTTNEGTDAWFIGFTPRVVGGVWIGLDDPAPIVPGATGGDLAAPVWGRVARRIDATGQGWSPPGGVETRQVDAAGNILAQGCPPMGAVREEYFLSGTVAGSTTCFSDYALYGDTLDPYGDASLNMDEETENWFERMRRRLFGEEAQTAQGGPPADTLRIGEPPPTDPRAGRLGQESIPPLEQPPAQPPRPDTTRRQPQQEPPELLGRPARPDTTRPDTSGAAGPRPRR